MKATGQFFQFPDGRVCLMPLGAEHADAFLAAARASLALHHPWLQAPVNPADFEALLVRAAHPGYLPLAIHSLVDQQFVGMLTLSQLIRGTFQNAFLSYWIGAGRQGQGLMTEALRLGMHLAFGELALHRLEANIQPGNVRSIALVRRVGFVKEGFSEKYLQVMGEWRDHERWAIHREIWPEGGLPAAELPTWRGWD